MAEAKQRLSEVLRAAHAEPQEILSRNRPVAVLIDPESFREFQAWREGQQRSLGEAFAELRGVCAEEGYRLPGRPRRNRGNRLADVLAHASR